MKKFCKPFYRYLLTTTIISFVLSLICVLAFISVFADVWFVAGILVTVAFVSAIGAQFLFAGVVLGWIGGFLDRIKLMIVSAVIISTGYALFLWMFFPWGVIIAFVIAVIPGLIFCKKQSDYINTQKAFSEMELSAPAD